MSATPSAAPWLRSSRYPCYRRTLPYATPDRCSASPSARLCSATRRSPPLCSSRNGRIGSAISSPPPTLSPARCSRPSSAMGAWTGRSPSSVRSLSTKIARRTRRLGLSSFAPSKGLSRWTTQRRWSNCCAIWRRALPSPPPITSTTAVSYSTSPSNSSDEDESSRAHLDQAMTPAFTSPLKRSDSNQRYQFKLCSSSSSSSSTLPQIEMEK